MTLLNLCCTSEVMSTGEYFLFIRPKKAADSKKPRSAIDHQQRAKSRVLASVARCEAGERVMRAFSCPEHF